MTARIRHTLCLMFAAGTWFIFPVSLRAQTPAPPLPVMKSPVDVFRELLALNPDEREHYLTNRPPQMRSRIFAKLKEYEALKPEERELRLRMTQLRWYLVTLLEIPPTERAAQLAAVPAADRQLVGDRLQQWDRLSPEEQKEVLKYQKTIESIMDNGGATNAAMVAASPQVRQESIISLNNFLKLPADRRAQMFASFKKFFELTDDEKQKTVGVLSSAQRAKMSNALQMFRNLPPEEREKYLGAINKFSRMSDAERQEFMKNAERWRALSPAERQAWRTLVSRLPPQPPQPPSYLYPPPPPRARLQVNDPTATNVSQ